MEIIINNKRLDIWTDEQLTNCIASEIEVDIFIHNKLDYRGKITNYTSKSVNTHEGSYIRENCVIQTKQNYFKVVLNKGE